MKNKKIEESAVVLYSANRGHTTCARARPPRATSSDGRFGSHRAPIVQNARPMCSSEIPDISLYCYAGGKKNQPRAWQLKRRTQAACHAGLTLVPVTDSVTVITKAANCEGLGFLGTRTLLDRVRPRDQLFTFCAETLRLAVMGSLIASLRFKPSSLSRCVHVKLIVYVPACEADKIEALGGWCVREWYGGGVSAASSSAARAYTRILFLVVRSCSIATPLSQCVPVPSQQAYTGHRCGCSDFTSRFIQSV